MSGTAPSASPYDKGFPPGLGPKTQLAGGLSSTRRCHVACLGIQPHQPHLQGSQGVSGAGGLGIAPWRRPSSGCGGALLGDETLLQAKFAAGGSSSTLAALASPRSSRRWLLTGVPVASDPKSLTTNPNASMQ